MANVLKLLVLSVLLSLFSVTALADGQTPAEETVCDFLQGGEYSSGLFGLCNAYCEAKDCDAYGPYEDQPRSCQKLFDNFERKATGAEDPAQPPCLEDPSPVCPCWPPESGRLADAGLGLPGLGCLVDFPGLGTVAEFNDFSNMVVFAATEEPGCEYLNDLEDPAVDIDIPSAAFPDPITPEEHAACRADVLELQDSPAFDGVPCFP
ncbi:MAG: hypothetical protein R3212_02690 [Xanthomonadales bacterium]|nr:hypothetical protein [Xanthomonadales bacterium]